jgi:hypothetical protein
MLSPPRECACRGGSYKLRSARASQWLVARPNAFGDWAITGEPGRRSSLFGQGALELRQKVFGQVFVQSGAFSRSVKPSTFRRSFRARGPAISRGDHRSSFHHEDDGAFRCACAMNNAFGNDVPMPWLEPNIHESSPRGSTGARDRSICRNVRVFRIAEDPGVGGGRSKPAASSAAENRTTH